jgi:hypothetical protein
MSAKISALIFYIGIIIFYLIDAQFKDFFYESEWGVPILYFGILLIVAGASLMALKLVHYEAILKRKSKKTKTKVGLSEYLKKNL